MNALIDLTKTVIKFLTPVYLGVWVLALMKHAHIDAPMGTHIEALALMFAMAILAFVGMYLLVVGFEENDTHILIKLIVLITCYLPAVLVAILGFFTMFLGLFMVNISIPLAIATALAGLITIPVIVFGSAFQ